MNYKELIISEDITVLHAMQRLDHSAKKVLFLTQGEKLAAALSDGDIRRWILNGGSLEAEVSRVANYSPKFIREEERPNAHRFMKKHYIEALPVVNQDHEIIDIVCIHDLQNCFTDSDVLRDVPVVIMAGGLGTRLYPYTKILPKPLIPIGDLPITEHIIHRFYQFGCQDFYMIVNHKKNMIKAYFNEIEKDYRLTFVDEDEPLGTGGGVGLLKGKINRTFVLTNCDTIIEEDYGKILKEHIDSENAVTMICALKNFSIPYGIVEIGEKGLIDQMKEKPEFSFFTNTGTYVVNPEIIHTIVPGKKIGFPDIIRNVQDTGMHVGVYPINEAAWLDMGQFGTMEEMREHLGV